MTNLKALTLLICFCVAISATAIEYVLPADSHAAGSVVLKPCSPGATRGFGGFNGSGGEWALEARCASEITFSSASGQPPKGGSVWTFPLAPPNHGIFSRVSMDLTGTDGAAFGRYQRVQVCAPAGQCGPSQTVTAQARRVLTLGAEIPEGADRLMFSSGCLAAPPATCLADSPMRISNLEITVTDGDPPSVGFSPEAAPGGTREVIPEFWNGGSRDLRIRATDVGTGIRYVSYQVRPPGSMFGPTWREGEFGCGVGASITATIPYLCPQSVDHVHSFPFGGPMDVYGIQPGLNTVAATAYDAAGNASEPLEFDVYLDHTAPVISNLRASPETPSDWRSTTEVGILWDYSNDVNPSGSESGIDLAKVTVSPEEPGIGSEYSFDVDASNYEVTNLGLPRPGRWRVSLVVSDRAGNESNRLQTHIRVDPTIPDAPSIDPISPVSRADLEAGRAITWSRPENESEVKSSICSFAVMIDRKATSEPMPPGGVPGSASEFELPMYMADGDYFFHVRAISCAGVAGGSAHRAFRVRTVAPEIKLSVPGAGGWYSPSDPLVAQLVEPQAGDQLSVTHLDEPDEWSSDRSLTASLDDGDQTIVVRSRDVLGNSQTVVRSVRFDGTAPTVTLDNHDPDRPRMIAATVTDRHSGIIDAQLQFRLLGSEGPWTGMVESSTQAEPGQQTRRVLARFPDQSLEDGHYELRVVSRDAAGNVISGGVRLDSTPARLSVPLRSKPTLIAEFREPRVAYGTDAALTGKILDSDGKALAGAELEVIQRVHDHPDLALGNVRSDANGQFSFLAKAGPSRLLVIRYPGSERDAPDQTSAPLIVSAGVTLKVNKTRARKKWRLAFRGEVKRRGAKLPKSGKVVKIQCRVGGKWKSLESEGLADVSGRFVVSYDFRSGRQPVRYRFRALVPAVDGWAYATGTSKTVTLVLK